MNVDLIIRSALPSENSLKRWFGEPVAVAILESDVRIPQLSYNKDTAADSSLTHDLIEFLLDFFN